MIRSGSEGISKGSCEGAPWWSVRAYQCDPRSASNTETALTTCVDSEQALKYSFEKHLQSANAPEQQADFADPHISYIKLTLVARTPSYDLACLRMLASGNSRSPAVRLIR